MESQRHIQRLLDLAAAQHNVYEGVAIAEAEKMLSAVDSVPAQTTEQKRAVNFLIVGMLHSGDEEKAKWAKETFFSRNEGFIGTCAKKYFGAFLGGGRNREVYDELYQCGVIGMMSALNSFDPSRSETASVTTWLTKAIIHEMYLFVNREGGEGGPEPGLRAKIAQARKKYAEMGIPEPTMAQLSAETGLPLSQVERALEAESLQYGEFDESYSAGAETPDPEDEAERAEQTEVLSAIFSALPETERLVLGMSCGYPDGVTYSLSEIARELGMTPKQVGLILSEAADRMKRDPRLLRLYDIQPDGIARNRNTAEQKLLRLSF